MSEYIAPARGLDAFHCPHCDAYAHQRWADAREQGFAGSPTVPLEPQVESSRCARCRRTALWIDATIIYPPSLAAAPPHDDLPEPALTTYNEARAIADDSPRAAAALLRLCLQQLIDRLGAESRNLSTAVGELVKRGLPQRLQKAMDTVRLIGNEAVHPGTIDLNDDPATAYAMFNLVNLIVEALITQPKMLDAFYDQLPETKRAQIERRDGAG